MKLTVLIINQLCKACDFDFIFKYSKLNFKNKKKLSWDDRYFPAKICWVIIRCSSTVSVNELRLQGAAVCSCLQVSHTHLLSLHVAPATATTFICDLIAHVSFSLSTSTMRSWLLWLWLVPGQQLKLGRVVGRRRLWYKTTSVSKFEARSGFGWCHVWRWSMTWLVTNARGHNRLHRLWSLVTFTLFTLSIQFATFFFKCKHHLLTKASTALGLNWVLIFQLYVRAWIFPINI